MTYQELEQACIDLGQSICPPEYVGNLSISTGQFDSGYFAMISSGDFKITVSGAPDAVSALNSLYNVLLVGEF